MPTKNVAKENRITKRVRDIINILDRYGTNTPHLRNYISDCMESDIRRERKANKELLDIINKPVIGTEVCPLKRKEK